MKYSENTLESIKSKLRLSDVVGSYIKLTKSSAKDDYKACCPFHHEKTPSFLVHDDKGFYKCFGCQKSGNMFSFVMEMDHLSFPEAVEVLAKKAGIELKEESAEEKRENNKQKAVQDIYNRIAKSYRHILLNDKSAEKARQYINKRGISQETSDKFLLGYAFDDPKWLYELLHNNNFSDEIIKETGLFSKNYDKLPLFRNRILFPIRTWQGNVVAFSGRDLSGESKAKYINSPETSLYSKKNMLFGFYESLPEIKKTEEITLCEGNFDVISLHQAGICNACAPLGTAFTTEQAKLIKRYCKKINLLFDSDGAGQNATKKAILIAQVNDIECNVIKPLNNAKDASQMLEEQGSENLKKSCLITEPAFSYLVHSALKMYDIRTPKGQLSVLKEVSPYLDATSSNIERQGYIKYLADILHVSEEEILADYSKLRSSDYKEEVVETKPDNINKKDIVLTNELNAMLLLINNKEMFDYFKKNIRFNMLTDGNAKCLFTVLEDANRLDISSNDILLEMITSEDLRNVVSSSMIDSLYHPNKIKDALDFSIKSIKYNSLVEKRTNIYQMINNGGIENLSSEEYQALLEAKSNIDKEMEDLKNEQ